MYVAFLQRDALKSVPIYQGTTGNTTMTNDLRRQGLGGHDIAAICLSHPYQTPLDVYLAKVEGVNNFNPNYVQGRGLALEPHLINTYMSDYWFPGDIEGTPTLANDQRFVHAKFSFMHAHPDAVLFDGDKPFRILECKAPTIAKRHEWGEEGTNQIPDYIKIQCAWYCAVLNVERIDILVDDIFAMKVYHWYRDIELEDQLTGAAVHFWENHIISKVPPGAANIDDVKVIYKKSNGLAVEATPEIWLKHATLKEVKSKLTALTKEKEYLEFEIRNFYQENEVCCFHGKEISALPVTIREDIDRPKLKKEFPFAWESCRKTSTFRTLRLK